MAYKPEVEITDTNNVEVPKAEKTSEDPKPEQNSDKVPKADKTSEVPKPEQISDEVSKLEKNGKVPKSKTSEVPKPKKTTIVPTDFIYGEMKRKRGRPRKDQAPALTDKAGLAEEPKWKTAKIASVVTTVGKDQENLTKPEALEVKKPVPNTNQRCPKPQPVLGPGEMGYGILPLRMQELLVLRLCSSCLQRSNDMTRIFPRSGEQHTTLVMCKVCAKKNKMIQAMIQGRGFVNI